MKAKLLILIALFSLTIFANESEVEPKIKTAIQQALLDYSNESRFSGSLLVAKNNKIIFHDAVGLANRSYRLPNGPEQTFLIGSLSKQFAAVIILQLIQENKLSLNDTIDKWFPDFPEEKSRIITIHHLLSHSSGLPHYQGLVDAGIDLSQYDRVDRSLEDYAKDISKMKLLSVPGTQFSYSSQGYILLGMIAQKVSGRSLDQLIQHRIVKPLGLTNTGFAYNDSIVNGLASAYDFGIYKNDEKSLVLGYKNSSYRDQTNTFCTGGIHSTAGDLFKWSQALLNNTLLSKTYQEKMTTVQAQPYGYGLFIENGKDWRLNNEIKILTHGGATTGYRSHISILDNGAYTIVALGNTDVSRSGALAHSVASILYGEKPEPANVLGTAVAWELVNQGKVAAIELFEKSKKQEYKNYLKNDFAFFSYSETFLELEHYSKAQDIIQIGMEAFPKSGLLFMGLGDVHMARNNSKQAISAYKQALVISESDPENFGQLKKMLIKKLEKAELSE